MGQPRLVALRFEVGIDMDGRLLELTDEIALAVVVFN